MEESDSQYPRPNNWKFLYRAAIFETNNHKKAKKISDAQEAIVERMRELFREHGIDAAGEREAMDDAMYALRAWKTVLDMKDRAGHAA